MTPEITFTTSTATAESYRNFYRHYISSIQPNRQKSNDLSVLNPLIHPSVIHNSNPLGLAGYKSLIQTNIISTGTTIRIEKLLVDVEERSVVARLVFTVPESCEELIGYKLKKAGEREEGLEVLEHVIYRFDPDKDDGGRMKIGEV
ncbi:hypothetical protein HII31_13115 [Pseudocercospora fuligena]|uniref:Uncharacterized protein n=1 Tax=Pseudocercospora fuligena TaxID=685502 RepID=A0A8H6R6U4_9PEZI|nr:hypothetical protein HII31_13115 [Pseudocercospora fuligena]